jgi:LysR family transcriptional regulator, transcriptional activator of nhaA
VLSLNFHHLRVFWVITQAGGLTAAARRLSVSPSTLSAQLKELEHRVGSPLFVRENKKLTLIETGQLVRDHCEVIFRTANELTRALGRNSGNRTLTLHVGSLATLSRNFQLEFLRPLLGRLDVAVDLRSASLRDLLAELRDHTIDIVLSNLPAPHAAETGWHSTLLHQQAVSLVSRPEEGRGRLKFPDALRTMPVILPSSQSNIRVTFDLLMAQHQIEPMIIAEVDDMSMLRLLAGSRPALTLVPPVVVRQELNAGELVERCKIPDLQERFYAITRARRFPNPLVHELLAAAKQKSPAALMR